MTNSLPGIREIYTVQTKRLPDSVVQRAQCGLPVAMLCEMEQVPFVSMPKCEAKEQWVNNARAETVTLTFESVKRMDTSVNRAWMIRDVNNRCWLIGAREMPFPCATRAYNTGTPAGDKAVYVYEVKWTSPIAMIQCMATRVKIPEL